MLSRETLTISSGSLAIVNTDPEPGLSPVPSEISNLQWLGGTITGSADTTILVDASMNMSSGTLDGPKLVIGQNAAAVWTPGGPFYLGHGAKLENEGTFTIHCESGTYCLGGIWSAPSRTGTIENRGTLVKEGAGRIWGPGGWGYGGMPLDSQNHGSVIVNGGELELYLTGDNEGHFSVVAGTAKTDRRPCFQAIENSVVSGGEDGMDEQRHSIGNLLRCHGRNMPPGNGIHCAACTIPNIGTSLSVWGPGTESKIEALLRPTT